MEEIIENIYFIAGDKHIYQYRTLIICTMFWIFANVLPSSLPYFESMPVGDLHYSNGTSSVERSVSLNYTMCNDPNAEFEILKIPEYSIIYHFGFYCNKYLVSLLGISIFAGGSVGSMMLQTVANHFGRKSSQIIALTLFTISIILVTYKVSYYFIFPLFFFIQLYTIAFCYASVTNLTEVTNYKLRTKFISIVNTGYSICGLIFTLVFYLGATWKTALYITGGAMIFFSILFLVFTTQTPRFYVSIGNYPAFYRSIRYIAKVNNRWELTKKILPIYKQHQELYLTPSSQRSLEDGDSLLNVYDKFYEPLMIDYEENKDVKKADKANNEEKLIFDDKKTDKVDSFEQVKKKTNLDYDDIQALNKFDSFKKNANVKKDTEKLIYLYFSEEDLKFEQNEISDFKKLMSYPSQRVNFNVLNFSWFTITGIYYFTTIFLKYLPGDIFMNATLLYGVELISYLSCIQLLNTLKFGRKDVLTLMYCLSLITLLIIVIWNPKKKMLMNLLFVLRFGIAGAHNLNFITSLEIYPTALRLTGFGINCNMGCFSAVFFPLFLEADIEKKVFIAFLIMISASLALITFYLPETNNTILSNVIPEEADKNLQTSKYFKKRRSIKNEQELNEYFINN